jgi:hypothetical protein
MCLFFPVPLTPHASAALRRLWLRARPSKGGVATEKSQNQEWRFAAFSGCTPRPVVTPWLSWLHGVMSLHAACECASRARSHTTLCVWWRRLPPHSSRRELHGARLCLACCRPRRPRRRDRRALHALALLYSMLLIHVPFIRPMTLTQAVDCGFMRATTGSRGGGWKVANLKVAFCHSFSSSFVRCCFVCGSVFSVSLRICGYRY